MLQGGETGRRIFAQTVAVRFFRSPHSGERCSGRCLPAGIPWAKMQTSSPHRAYMSRMLWRCCPRQVPYSAFIFGSAFTLVRSALSSCAFCAISAGSFRPLSKPVSALKLFSYPNRSLGRRAHSRRSRRCRPLTRRFSSQARAGSSGSTHRAEIPTARASADGWWCRGGRKRWPVRRPLRLGSSTCR